MHQRFIHIWITTCPTHVPQEFPLDISTKKIPLEIFIGSTHKTSTTKIYDFYTFLAQEPANWAFAHELVNNQQINLLDNLSLRTKK